MDVNFEDHKSGGLSESFLAQVAAHAIGSSRTRSIFEVGARGHYENPVSDLLAFFMNPENEHGLGALFLEAYFEVLGDNVPSLSSLNFVRECTTENGNRIDLVVLGTDWALAIENKIEHVQNNPFGDYDRHMRGLREKVFYSVLSPSGSMVKGWKGVTYASYLDAVRARLSAVHPPVSPRWKFLTEEVLLNLENQATVYCMKSEDFEFADRHMLDLQRATELFATYKVDCARTIQEEMEQAFSGMHIGVQDAGWPDHVLSFRCKSDSWMGADMVLFCDKSEHRIFSASVYLSGKRDDRRGAMDKALPKEWYHPDSYPRWTVRADGAGLAEGLKSLVRLARAAMPHLTSYPTT